MDADSPLRDSSSHMGSPETASGQPDSRHSASPEEGTGASRQGAGPRARELQGRVVAVRHYGTYTLVSVAAPQIAQRARPGQFVMVGVPGGAFPLRRPFSIHSATNSDIRLLIEPRGRGSALLAEVVVGERLDLAGPLGNGFPLTDVSTAVLVGGGIGVAPLQFVAEALRADGVPVLAALGFRDAGQARLLGALTLDDTWIATEDGSLGRHGTVVALLDAIKPPAPATLYTCGPRPMIDAVVAWAAAHRLAGFASLEAHMACGTGACQGCVVATRSGYRRVCVDGPVFAFADLVPSEARE